MYGKRHISSIVTFIKGFSKNLKTYFCQPWVVDDGFADLPSSVEKHIRSDQYFPSGVNNVQRAHLKPGWVQLSIAKLLAMSTGAAFRQNAELTALSFFRMQSDGRCAPV